MFNYDEYGNVFIDMRLHRLRVLITEQCDDFFMGRGISTSSANVSVMLFLKERGQASIAQIAESLGYSHQLINHRLRQLEKQGYLGRHTDARDSRKWLIRLTPAGLEEATLIQNVLPEMGSVFDRLFEDIDPAFCETVDKFIQALSAQTVSQRADADSLCGAA